MENMPFFPPEGSTFAPQVDSLFFFELAVSLVCVAIICGLVIYFAVKYRRRSEDYVPEKQTTHYAMEATWTSATFILMLVMYFWGAGQYVKMRRPPAPGHAMEIHVLGKQWMWKIEHADGIREINELHVPVGQPVQLVLTSQDVIHDFFVPAFRMKQDVIPGSYVSEWFIATKPGRYHLFCSQYCGTDHSRMVGWVTVMTPSDFEAWRAGVVPSVSPAVSGQKLFVSYGCNTCHGEHAPTLAGLYLSKVKLADGKTVTADENYLRESIEYSTAKLVLGYPPIMPSYRGQLSEEQIGDLISYIKSLGTGIATPGPTTGIASQTPTSNPTTPPPPSPSGYSPQQLPDFPPARQPPEIAPPPSVIPQPR